jgi:hypothetical protein
MKRRYLFGADVLGHADVNTTRRHYAAMTEQGEGSCTLCASAEKQQAKARKEGRMNSLLKDLRTNV